MSFSFGYWNITAPGVFVCRCLWWDAGSDASAQFARRTGRPQRVQHLRNPDGSGCAGPRRKSDERPDDSRSQAPHYTAGLACKSNEEPPWQSRRSNLICYDLARKLHQSACSSKWLTDVGFFSIDSPRMVFFGRPMDITGLISGKIGTLIKNLNTVVVVLLVVILVLLVAAASAVVQ